MTVEEKKQFLRGYKEMFEKLDILKLKKKEIKEDIESLKSLEYTDMPKTYKKTDLSDCIVRLEEQEEKINNQIAEIQRTKAIINDALLILKKKNEINVIDMHYLKFIGWEEIGKELGYSRSQILRFHGDALQNIKL